jgi:actin related protein 2/3 complex, subunit 5
LNSENQEIKIKSAELVGNVLAAIVTNDEKILSSLTQDQQDLLMKYIYKGLESGTNSINLLKFHGKLLKIAGTGSIVRALSEKRSIL